MEEITGLRLYLTFTLCDLKKHVSLIISVNASFINS